jgi:hypothetical protein
MSSRSEPTLSGAFSSWHADTIGSGATTTTCVPNATWTGSTTTAIYPYAIAVSGGAAAYVAPADPPRTALDWLRERVAETVDLARAA